MQGNFYYYHERSRTISGIALTMLSIGLAAGIFKPLVSGTVRVVMDKSNKTLGFGIFYAIVNVGASKGPVVMGQLRSISCHNAFLADVAAVGLMLLISIRRKQVSLKSGRNNFLKKINFFLQFQTIKFIFI